MKTILSIITISILLLWIGELTVTFKPFSVSLPGWHKAAGILLFWLSMVVYQGGERARWYKEGFNDAVKKSIDILEKNLKSGDLRNESVK